MDEIWAYSAEKWSPVKADAYVRDILVAFADLETGRRNGTPALVRFKYLRLLVGSHIILYQATATNINIIRILHQSMDVRRHV